MRVYTDAMFGRGTIFVTPGTDHPETSEFFTETREGGRSIRKSIQFCVQFTAGAADVSDAVGKYLLAKKLVRRSPLIIPVAPLERMLVERTKYASPIEVGKPMHGFVSA